MPKDTLNLDYETYSEADLTQVGSHTYARDPSTEILMCAYRLNGGPIRQWIPAEGQPAPRELDEAMTDPDVLKWAWNASFEMVITKFVWGKKVDLRQWRDTMVLGHYCGFPGKLEQAGPAAGLPEELCKNPAGKRLMRKFSMRNASRKKDNAGELVRTYWFDDPKAWEGYLEYNRDDVKAESMFREKFIAHDLPMDEWELWWLDQKINQAGVPINMAMVENACRLYNAAYAEGLKEMQGITGLKNPMSTQQLLPWLHSNGYMFADCKKGHIRQAYSYFKTKPEHWSEEEHAGYIINEDFKRVLELRLELSRTSIKKYFALRTATSDDGNLRNIVQFMGAARTARWAGRVVQLQNLPRPDKRFEKGIEVHAKNVEQLDLRGVQLIYDNTFDLLATCIRPAIQAPDGYLLVDADLNAIENRVLGWLAGCEKILRVFELNRDPYIDFATYLFGKDYDTLWHEYKVLGDSSKRTIAKPGVLGCGYMLGPGKVYEDRDTGEIEATGLLGYAWDMGVRQFTLKDSEVSVKTFRREFSEVKDFWYEIERAAIRCVKTRTVQGCGHVTFDMKGDFLRMQLPSGRYLHYFKPDIRKTKMPWKNDDGSTAYKMSLTYEGQNDKKQWVRMPTHPGKLTENADQAISRDLLAHGMKLANKRGIDIRLHVHDQIVGLVREDEAEKALECLRECMGDPPKWAKGLPLGSAGFISKVFKKD